MGRDIRTGDGECDSNNVLRFILNWQGKKQAAVLLAAVIMVSILDTIGIAIIFPYTQIIANPKLLSESSLISLFGLQKFSDVQLIVSISVALVFLFIAKVIIQGLLIRYQHRKLTNFTARLTDDTVGKILATRYGMFQELPGSELAGVTYSNTVHATLVFRSLIQIGNELCFLSILGVVFLILNPVATLFGLLLLGIIGGTLYWLVIGPSTKLGKQQSVIENSRYRLLFSIVNSIRDIKVMGLASLFNEKNQEVSKEYSEIALRYNFNNELPKLLVETVALIAFVIAVLGILLSGVQMQQLLPVIGVVGVASIRIIPAFTRLMAAFGSYRFSRSFVQRLIFIRNRLSALKHSRTEDSLSFNRTIELQGIGFGYGEKAVLKDIDIRIDKGHFIGIVGTSGAGKTTLLDIITGLQPASEGNFLCDGKSFDPFTSQSMEKMIGYVPQVLTLLDESIAYNITFDNEPDLNRLMKVIRMANLNTLIEELPQGVSTRVGENGMNLSGGQRQRIGIARALYRNPKIVVFDEATGALDAHTEQEVSREIEKLRGEVTMLMVSHRLPAVVNCDHIYILAHGRVEDSGTHDELLKRCELYKDLYALQTTFA